METNSKWQVSGGAAERYEENLVPVIFIPWARELLNRAELIAGEAVLDVACGTGIVARMASDLVGSDAEVVGADINAGMLTVARSKSKEEGKLIDWIEGGGPKTKPPRWSVMRSDGFRNQRGISPPHSPAGLTQMW